MQVLLKFFTNIAREADEIIGNCCAFTFFIQEYSFVLQTITMMSAESRFLRHIVISIHCSEVFYSGEKLEN